MTGELIVSGTTPSTVVGNCAWARIAVALPAIATAVVGSVYRNVPADTLVVA